MRKFEFVTPGKYKGLSADDAAAELERIRIKNGELNPKAIVEESRDEKSVLHNYFCWDDAKAAEGYRREQARQLMKNIRVIVTNETITTPIRAFVYVHTEEKPGTRSYYPIHEIVDDEAAYNDLLEQARADMESFVSKYAQLKELANVRQAMLSVLGEG